MLIILMLLPMIVLTFISVIFGNEFLGISVSQELISALEVNGTVPEWLNVEGLTGGEYLFNIDLIIGAIAIITVIAVISIGVGIQVLGSGLSETSVKMIITALAYMGLWLVLSVLSMPLIFSIEIFGTLIYVGLTLGYVLGVVEKMTGGNI